MLLIHQVLINGSCMTMKSYSVKHFLELVVKSYVLQTNMDFLSHFFNSTNYPKDTKNTETLHEFRI